MLILMLWQKGLMQPFKTENRKSRLNPFVKALGRLIVGFYLLKRIQENQRGSIEQKRKNGLRVGGKAWQKEN